MPENKWQYDLSHMSFQAGRIGSIQGQSFIPVIAGDVLEIDLVGVWRLSALRRNLTMDAVIDLYAFYIPYRHIYGDDTWRDFIKAGVDEATTLPSTVLSAGFLYGCYGGYFSGTAPNWLVGGYNQIFNRYFRHPTDTAAEVGLTDLPGSPLHGRSACHLPRIWNTGIDETVDASDLQISTAGDVMDLTDFARGQARLRTERRRDFFNVRYNDLLEGTWGSQVNFDADQRPEMVWHERQFMSGHDVDGTADATLGQYSGKALSVVTMRIPRRMYTEHGTLWLVSTVRFPPVHTHENHYLVRNVNPSYPEIAGDPDVVAKEGPVTLNLQDYFNTAISLTTDAGQVPFGQWYREQPNFVHPSYASLQGFAFVDSALATKENARYVAGASNPGTYNEYNDVFLDTSLHHWQSYSRIDVNADRAIPPVASSIFAGTS